MKFVERREDFSKQTGAAPSMPPSIRPESDDETEPSARERHPGRNGTQLPDPDSHDMLIVDELGQLYRFEFNRDERSNGAFTFDKPAAPVQFSQEGERKVSTVAGGYGKEATPSVAGFTLLPIRPNPASGFFCCYLVNTPFFLGAKRAAGVHLFDIPRRKLGNKRYSYAFTLPAVSTQGSAPKARLEAARLPAKPIVALGLDKDGKFTLDANMFDFVNPWTKEDWSGPEPKEPQRKLLGTDPWGLVIQRGATQWSFVDTQQGTPDTLEQDATKLSLPPNGVLGLLSDDRAFLDLNQFAAAESQTDHILLALPNGDVYPLDLSRSKVGKALDLRAEPEVWRLLRSGCVLGRVARTLGGDEAPALLVNLCSLTVPSARARVTPPVSGTLDFKWSTDRPLRIRFLEPPAIKGVEEARTFVIKSFKAWTKQTRLEVTFLDDLPANKDKRDKVEQPYDILVSLDRLHQIPETDSYPEREVGLPVSDLGSYALRRSYGSPTMLLGQPHKGILSQQETAEYFDSKEFKHFVTHEVGHALGLPHLHQAPGASVLAKRKSLALLRDELNARFGLDLDVHFIQEELLKEWANRDQRPAQHSEWLSDAEILEAINDGGKAVMLGFPDVSLYESPILAQATELRSTPGELDLRWIKKLYG